MTPAANEERILLAHGGGGTLSAQLVREVFLPAFGNPALDLLGDAAVLDLPSGRLAFTTDSFVVSPLFFPGGDIGSLAVAGSVNDLAVSGARPRFLSCAFVLEEGFPLADLRRVVGSMARTAEEAGVMLVAGDTKVVGRSGADGLFLTTAGIGELREDLPDGWGAPRAGDLVLVNGCLGDHGLAILAAREKLGFASSLASDCAPLNGLIDALFSAGVRLRFLRDATRGGLAAVLNELAAGRSWGINLQEAALPVSPAARGLSEILGIDPLCVANEGKLVAVVAKEDAERALRIMKCHELGREAAAVGRVEADLRGLVTLETGLGGRRILDMPLGEQLPRIC